MKGVSFISHGHYGSSVFDPMDGSSLEISLCDDCVTSKINEPSIIFEVRSQPNHQVQTPQEHEELRQLILDFEEKIDDI